MQTTAQHLNRQFWIGIILLDVLFCLLNDINRHIFSSLHELRMDLTAKFQKKLLYFLCRLHMQHLFIAVCAIFKNPLFFQFIAPYNLQNTIQYTDDIALTLPGINLPICNPADNLRKFALNLLFLFKFDSMDQCIFLLLLKISVSVFFGSTSRI